MARRGESSTEHETEKTYLEYSPDDFTRFMQQSQTTTTTIEAVKNYFDRWQMNLRRSEADLHSAVQRNEDERRALREERAAFLAEKQREEAERERLGNAIASRNREMSRRELEFQQRQARIEEEDLKNREKAADIEAGHQRLLEEREKYASEFDLQRKHLQSETQSVETDRLELEKKRSLLQQDVHVFQQEKREFAETQKAWEDRKESETQQLMMRTSEIEQRLHLVGEREQQCRERAGQIERHLEKIEADHRDFEEDFAAREKGLEKREVLFQEEVSEQERKVNEAEQKSTEFTQRVDELNAEKAQFAQMEQTRTTELASWEEKLTAAQSDVDQREGYLKDKEAECDRRAAQLQEERALLIEDRNTFQNECHEKMRRFNEEEQKIEERTKLLEQNVEEFRTSVVELNTREQQVRVREVAMEEMEQTREEERMTLENVKTNLEAREQNLTQAMNELNIEKEHNRSMAADNENEKMRLQEWSEALQQRSVSLDNQERAIAEKESLLMQRSQELDRREENLRKAEGPFAVQKKDLENREAYLKEFEEDICTRETQFLKRMENGNREVLELKERVKAELAKANHLKEQYERESDETHRKSQTTMENLIQRERNVERREAQLKELEEDLIIREERWKRFQRLMDVELHETIQCRRSSHFVEEQQRPEHSIATPVESDLPAMDEDDARDEAHQHPVDQAPHPEGSIAAAVIRKRRVVGTLSGTEDAAAVLDVPDGQTSSDHPIPATKRSVKSIVSAARAAQKRPLRGGGQKRPQDDVDSGTPKKRRSDALREGEAGAGWNQRLRRPTASGESTSHRTEDKNV